MQRLDFEFKNFKITDLKLTITVSADWFDIAYKWLSGAKKTPVLWHGDTKWILYEWDWRNDAIVFIPLKKNKYITCLFLEENRLFFETAGYEDGINCTEFYEHDHCDICDTCFNCNEEVSYFNLEDHPTTLIKYEKKYNVLVNRVCEYCMDDDLISNED